MIPPAIVEDIARLCASVAHLERGGLFLDAGVGTGRFAVPLQRAYPGQIVGGDISLRMMRHAREKSPELMLAQTDLQRLPFRRGTFQGALAVHVLHVIARWMLVVDELRRVLVPQTGVLLLGIEQGGHSAIVEHYYAQARGMGVLRSSLGAPGLPRMLTLLRQGGAHIDLLSAPFLSWTRQWTVEETLDSLARRTYSQMWSIPDDVHRLLLAQVQAFAARSLGSPNTIETVPVRFLLHAVRWP